MLVFYVVLSGNLTLSISLDLEHINEVPEAVQYTVLTFSESS